MTWRAFVLSHFKGAWKYYAAVLGVIVLLIKVYSPLKALCVAWLGVAGMASEVVAFSWITLLFLLVALVFTVGGLYKSHKKETTQGQQGEILLKTFHRTQQAADLISKKLFPGPSQTRKKVLSCKQVWTIFDNGDCNFTEVLALTTKEKDIHFLQKGIDAEPEADPVEFPDQIDLKIESTTPAKQVVYLINKNELRSKRFVVFFLPFIRAGVDDRRDVKMTYYWKGLMRKLIAFGEEDFTYEVKSVEPIPEVEYQFWIKPQAGTLACSNIGPELDPGTETLEPVEDEKGLKGWIYRGKNLPGDHVTRLRLELENR